MFKWQLLIVKKLKRTKEEPLVSYRNACNKVRKAEIREQNEKECECVFWGAWGMVK